MSGARPFFAAGLAMAALLALGYESARLLSPPSPPASAAVTLPRVAAPAAVTVTVPQLDGSPAALVRPPATSSTDDSSQPNASGTASTSVTSTRASSNPSSSGTRTFSSGGE